MSKDPSLAIDEIDQCIKLQKEIGWETNLVPAHIFRADSIGLIEENIDLGYVLLALSYKQEDKENVIGFARVSATMNPQKHWLHELAVSSEMQSQGIGYHLMKAIQKKSLELGGRELYFTFDPINGKNACLYLTKCGARAIKIYDNFYGKMAGAPHVNEKTHRFLCQWGLSAPQYKPENKNFNKIQVLADLSSLNKQRTFAVEVPCAVQEVDQAYALKWQEKTFPLLDAAINLQGYQAVYLYRSPDKHPNFLILDKTDFQGNQPL
ncbi:MAG: GNAT family N-acetyltransferase [Gammaproteobacteria bacterium]|nr:GNAT family N-acetyltransferase [Gammaproteobacteria bacterium]